MHVSTKTNISHSVAHFYPVRLTHVEKELVLFKMDAMKSSSNMNGAQFVQRIVFNNPRLDSAVQLVIVALFSQNTVHL